MNTLTGKTAQVLVHYGRGEQEAGAVAALGRSSAWPTPATSARRWRSSRPTRPAGFPAIRCAWTADRNFDPESP